MAKKNTEYLDVEAMKMGYKMMHQEAVDQLAAGMHTESVKIMLTDRIQHIVKRLEAMEK